MMPQYIDAELLMQKLSRMIDYCEKNKDKKFNALTALFQVGDAIMDCPVADVAPKSEVDRLEYILLGVMHSVDKWLDGEELEQDEVNRAITMREKTLRIIENAKSEVAREIFEEIDKIFRNRYKKCSENSELKLLEPIRQCERFVINEIWDYLTELKKKYTEEKEQ